MADEIGERQAFEAAMRGLGKPDDEFNNYHLEEGALYSLWGKAWIAARTPTADHKAVREALEFYAHRGSYSTTADMKSSVWVDGGKRAGIALATVKTPLPEQTTAAAEPDNADVERVAAIIDPGAFVGTPQQIHMHCSSYRVDVVQEKARHKARQILSALQPAPQLTAKPDKAEVVERVAAAIAAYEWEYGMADSVREDFGLYLAENKREYDGKAKAALSALPPLRDDNEWQPIATIPKDGTRVYLKNLNGEVDHGEWYPHGDDPGHGGINSVYGLGSDDSDLGYSWWKPMRQRDDSGVVEEMVAALDAAQWLLKDIQPRSGLVQTQIVSALSKATRVKAGE